MEGHIEVPVPPSGSCHRLPEHPAAGRSGGGIFTTGPTQEVEEKWGAQEQCSLQHHLQKRCAQFDGLWVTNLGTVTEIVEGGGKQREPVTDIQPTQTHGLKKKYSTCKKLGNLVYLFVVFE